MNSGIFFGEAGNGAEKVAIADASLQNIGWVDGAPADEDRILNDFVDSLPYYFFGLPAKPERLLLWREIGVRPLFIGMGILLDQPFVVGFEHFPHDEVLKLLIVVFHVADDAIEPSDWRFVVPRDPVDDLGSGAGIECFEHDILLLADN